MAATLRDTDTDPALVTLEVTESVFVEDAERALVVLDELKRLGTTLALDDFGTGYSSLSYLNRFPSTSSRSTRGSSPTWPMTPPVSVIVSAVEMSHLLGMTVVAEGVETVEHHSQVEALGCDSCQGFYFARPMPAEHLGALMHLQTRGSDLRLPVLAD